jgi:sorting nexin-29
MIKGGGITIPCEIPKLISIWDKEELSEEWKEFVIVPNYKKDNKIECSNYKGISLLPTTYKMLPNVMLSSLIPYEEEINGDNQCAFRRNSSTTDDTFSIRPVLEKKWEYNEAVHQLFTIIDLKKVMIQLKGRSCIIFS